MFLMMSSIFFFAFISWDLSLIFFSINFIITIVFLSGNQTNLFDKSILSSMMVLLSILIITLMIQSSNSYILNKNFSKSYYISVLIMVAILVSCFYSYNFFLFYFLFELVVIPTFFIILGWGYSTERIQAGTYLFIYTLIASLPFLIFMLYLFNKSSSLVFDNNFFSMEKEVKKFWWLMISMVFMVKMPIFLVHIWLPKAHVEAPVSGSMILAGILLKLGSYGFLKSFSGNLMSFISNEYILFSLSLMGSLIISLNCLRQNDLKCLVAYSSVAHMNIMMMALLSFSWMSIKGAIIMMIAHGLSSSAMFFILNTFYLANKSRNIIIMKSLLMSSSILSFWWFLLCCLNMSCPPSINFISEIFMASAIFSCNSIMSAILIIILIISGIYSVALFNLANHGSKTILYYFNMNSLNDFSILNSHIFFSFFLILITFMF